MTAEDFRRRLASLEDAANADYAAALASRKATTGNGGRYWYLGGIVTVMRAERQRDDIERRLAREIEDLEADFYGLQ